MKRGPGYAGPSAGRGGIGGCPEGTPHGSPHLMPRFSRLASDLQDATNPLYREREAILAAGGKVVDLVSGNVTEQGIVFPQDLLNEILRAAAAKARIYRPHPLGQEGAREAVSGYYASRGLSIPASRILLTPGTSVACFYLFSILADPGDEILVPSPSYPLFDEIARISGVSLVPYRLDESRGWGIDLDHLTHRISRRTRALALVSPHNPTGAVFPREELETVSEIAGRCGLPIIADEVFGEFLSGLETLPRPAALSAPLVVTLNGFSKLFALPGIKLGWMALTGEDPFIRTALTALERIADAFLPINEIVQAAVPEIFSRGERFLGEYRDEISRRRDGVVDLLQRARGIACVPPMGGFYAAVRVIEPGGLDDEELAVEILRKTGVLVHPGFFYDLEPTHLVFSTASDPAVSLPALKRVLEILPG